MMSLLYGMGTLVAMSLSPSAAGGQLRTRVWEAGSLFMLAGTGRRTVLTGAFAGCSGLMLRGKNAGILVYVALYCQNFKFPSMPSPARKNQQLRIVASAVIINSNALFNTVSGASSSMHCTSGLAQRMAGDRKWTIDTVWCAATCYLSREEQSMEQKHLTYDCSELSKVTSGYWTQPSPEAAEEATRPTTA